MSRDLNWTIMISLFFRSFLQTRILRFSGETASAKRVRGARHTRQGRRLYQSRLSTATSCFVRQMNGKIPVLTCVVGECCSFVAAEMREEWERRSSGCVHCR